MQQSEFEVKYNPHKYSDSNSETKIRLKDSHGFNGFHLLEKWYHSNSKYQVAHRAEAKANYKGHIASFLFSQIVRVQIAIWLACTKIWIIWAKN